MKELVPRPALLFCVCWVSAENSGGNSASKWRRLLKPAIVCQRRQYCSRWQISIPPISNKKSPKYKPVDKITAGDSIFLRRYKSTSKSNMCQEAGRRNLRVIVAVINAIR